MEYTLERHTIKTVTTRSLILEDLWKALGQLPHLTDRKTKVQR